MTTDRFGNPPTVYKGHGTENDFVIIEDLDDELDLTPGLVRALCDRHAGIGGDGILRVVRAPSVGSQVPGFYMDYRNADGSLAEMCGNGARVFVRFLLDRGLAAIDGMRLVTRAGVVEVGGPGADEPADWVSVTLGPAARIDASPTVEAPGMHRPRPGIAVSMPNPHVVVFIDADELDVLDLSRPPSVTPPLPEGQNVEFIVRGDHRLRMRVSERGVGETRSCGTGIAAAVVAAALTETTPTGTENAPPAETSRPPGDGCWPAGGDGTRWHVDVPGGTCGARWRPDGHVVLSGPAVIVGSIAIDPQWWALAR